MGNTCEIGFLDLTWLGLSVMCGMSDLTRPLPRFTSAFDSQFRPRVQESFRLLAQNNVQNCCGLVLFGMCGCFCSHCYPLITHSVSFHVCGKKQSFTFLDATSQGMKWFAFKKVNSHWFVVRHVPLISTFSSISSSWCAEVCKQKLCAYEFVCMCSWAMTLFTSCPNIVILLLVLFN